MEPANTSLHCLIYISSATEEFTSEELEQILNASRNNNTKLGVTGMLLYSNGNIIQVLEGERSTINKLYEHIRNDNRHFGIIKLIDKSIASRNFGAWSMGFKDVKTKNSEGFKNLAQNDFLPHEIKDPSILTILQNFVKNNY